MSNKPTNWQITADENDKTWVIYKQCLIFLKGCLYIQLRGVRPILSFHIVHFVS